MEFVQDLSWVDLAVILLLAVGVFAGFTQGTIVYLLNSLALLVAFVVAAQLKGPLLDLLGFWNAFSPEGRELIIFMILFLGLSIAAWFVIFALPSPALAERSSSTACCPLPCRRRWMFS